MVAMMVSCCVGTAPIAASMVIDGPEAIDDASALAGRSAAEDAVG
jgi:hypothetical protein